MYDLFIFYLKIVFGTPGGTELYNLKGYALEYVNYLNKAVILKNKNEEVLYVLYDHSYTVNWKNARCTTGIICFYVKKEKIIYIYIC